MRKKRIFIGSSSKELELAEIAKKILEPEFEVRVWKQSIWKITETVFGINENFLQSLLKAALKFDYGILLGTPDDQKKVKDKIVLEPRDNVIFELGLFIGRLGLSKCAFIIDEEIKVLSDLEGITLPGFMRNDLSTFEKAVVKVKDTFLKQRDVSLNFFPSSTLASVYFQNLIFPTCNHVIENNGFNYRGKKYDQCMIKIIIPQKIGADLNLQFEKVKNDIKTEKTSFPYKGRPRFIHLEAEIKNGKLIFVDLPTILIGINYAIRYLLPDEFNEANEEYEMILNRELERFIETLQHMITKEGFEEYIKLERI